ncbi:MAG: pilus assembly protein PilM [Lysinibacillus sp.]
MFKLGTKTTISISLNDYVLRALVKKGPNVAQWQVHEIPLPKGMIVDAIISDEVALFGLLKENTAKLHGKKQNVRLFVPDASVLLKTFEHPHDIESRKLKEFVEMEIGQSIHLPFQEPLIDVYDHIPGDGVATLFAASSEEVHKMINLALDLKMVPEAVDIRALCNLRILKELKKISDHKTYLIADWSINELSICIYSDGQVEFLRFQTINTDMAKWQATTNADSEITFSYSGDIQDYRMHVTDQVLELERMMNFFKFSLHKGEKSVEEMILMGDNPLLDNIQEFLRENLETPLVVIDDRTIAQQFPNFKAKHASLIGLALKEVQK